jgi:hypothetical protein
MFLIPFYTANRVGSHGVEASKKHHSNVYFKSQVNLLQEEGAYDFKQQRGVHPSTPGLTGNLPFRLPYI